MERRDDDRGANGEKDDERADPEYPSADALLDFT
jgi:hypothetical protein